MRGAVLLAGALLLTACGRELPEGVAPGPGRAVLALDAATGAVRWRKEVSPPSAATDPVLVGGVVVVPADGLVVGYDARDGERLWSVPDGGLLPRAAAGQVVLDRAGTVRAVDPRSGRLLWQAETGLDLRVWAGDGGVLLEDDGSRALPATRPGAPVPVVTPGVDRGGRTVRLLDDRGRERWRRGLSAGPYTADVGEGGVVLAGRDEVLLLEAADGRVRWRLPRPADGGGDEVLVAGDRVVVRTEGAVVGLDAATGSRVWRVPGSGTGAGRLQVRGGSLLVPSVGGPTRVLRLADGAVEAVDEDSCYDAALAAGRLVRTCRAVVEARQDGRRVWRHEDALVGPRPYLAVDADDDDDVVVGILGWGQPETRD